MVQQVTTPETTNETTTPNRLSMTYEEFEDWYTEGRRGEWVDGEVIEFVAPKTIHQEISGFLFALIRFFVDAQTLGRVLPQPIEMRLRDGRSYREPDLVFVASANLGRVTGNGVDGAGDLVVEIISDDSARRDRKDKFDEYAEAGVREYWVVDPRPLRQALFVYCLTDEGYYEQLRPDAEGLMHSSVIPGLWINPAWLWQERSPNLVDVLRLLAIIP